MNGRRDGVVHLHPPTPASLAAKPLKKMVGATGIEPVTPAMSTHGETRKIKDYSAKE